MYLWRRSASAKWFDENEARLRALAGDQLTVIDRPNRKRLQIEVASKSRMELQGLAKQFGGRIAKLPRDWLKRALRRKTKPMQIGKGHLLIPAGAAFGTGAHATTAMCVKLLERVLRLWGAQAPPPAGDRALAVATFSTKSFSARRRKEHARRVRSPDLVADLGTGSGILALAAKLLGAKRVVGIDNDPVAISTAKEDARLNKIRGVKFRVGDVRRYKLPAGTDVICANLFSELLIEIVPKLKAARVLILSGILGTQERDVRRALARNRTPVIEVRRRGKWVAILAGRGRFGDP